MARSTFLRIVPDVTRYFHERSDVTIREVLGTWLKRQKSYDSSIFEVRDYHHRRLGIDGNPGFRQPG
jgi:hypothetical protein